MKSLWYKGSSYWMRVFVFAVLLSLFIKYLIQVFTEFSMVFVDPDQVLMMYGTQEFLLGHFHWPRFFGQNYGTMLESFVAIPFSSLGLDVALPLASCVLWLMPYLLIVTVSGDKFRSMAFLLLWLLIMPVEYVLIGTMPRDFVSGIAVTSFALLFIRGNKKWSLIMLGLCCALGWSVNQNAALLGATITIYRIFSVYSKRLATFIWILVGYIIGFAIHAGIQIVISMHPECIVHQAWPLTFDIGLIGKAFAELDVYWAALTPFAYKKSWVYILLFVFILFVSRKKKDKATAYAIVVLLLIVFASFGVPKIHDGFESIFSPYERMFLALPVAIFFLLHGLNVHKQIPILILLIFGVAFYCRRSQSVDGRIITQTYYNANHILPYANIEDVQNRLKFIQYLADSCDVDVVMLGPGGYFLDVLTQIGHLGFTDNIRMISPGFDRKTWLLRDVDEGEYPRVLWLQTSLSAAEITERTGIKVTDLNLKNARFKEEGYYYLLEGDAIRPLKVYADCGFPLCNF